MLLSKRSVDGSQTYKHPKWPLTDAILEFVKPVFDRLASVTFLEQCKNCTNQNANESFNSLVWNLSPKESSNSPIETLFALNLAVLIFNHGFENTVKTTLEKCKISYLNSSEKQWGSVDSDIIYYANYMTTENAKERRKRRKHLDLKKQDAFQHIEGTQYQSGAFCNN